MMNANVLESIVSAESADTGEQPANDQTDGAVQPAGDSGTPSEARGGLEEGGRADNGQDVSGVPDKPAAQKPEAQKQDTVPIAALHEARETVKQLKAKIAEFEAQPRLTAEDAALLKELKEARAAQQQKEQEPDFLADPKGYVDKKVQTALKKLEEAERVAKDTDQKVTQQQIVQAVLNTAAQHEAEFSKATPDYPQAVQHIRTLRATQLQAFYPDATPQQIAQAVSQEEIQYAHQLLSQGRNVAEFAYNYAKQLGYKPAEAPKPNGQAQPDKTAVRTLGSGGSDGAPEADASEDPNSEFLAAQGELIAAFRRK